MTGVLTRNELNANIKTGSVADRFVIRIDPGRNATEERLAIHRLGAVAAAAAKWHGEGLVHSAALAAAECRLRAKFSFATNPNLAEVGPKPVSHGETWFS